MDATCTIQDSIHVFSLVHKYVSRILGTYHLSRVFEKGFTGSNRNKANATGMGLYLSKKLSDRLGLKLDITSKETEYTRLTITFPKGTVHNLH